MFWFIIGLLLVLGAVPFLLKRNVEIADSYGDKKDVPVWIGGAFFLVIGFLIILASSVYRQDPGEAIVIRSAGGDIAKVDTTAGWGFTAPWNSQSTFNIRNQRIEMFSNEGGEGADGAAISAPLDNGSNASVSITVRYSIRADAVGDIYRVHRSQDNLLDNVLKPGLRDEMREVTAEYGAFSVKQNRGEISGQLLEALETRWEEDGVEVDAIDLGDIALDAATEEALQQVNARQAEVEAAEADLERARVEAEATKVDAQASADADQIIRCGATVTTETREVNGEPTEVTVVTPKAGTKCENRLNDQVITNNYIEALREIGADGNLIVVSDDVNAILDVAGKGAQPPAG